MKLCLNCSRTLPEDISTCPNCGSEVGNGLKRVDDYQILDIVHEGYASVLCKAKRNGESTPVMLRYFPPSTGIMTDDIAYRLKLELEELRSITLDGFVKHLHFTKSSEGVWYRVSEWIDSENWGDLIASGVFNDYSVAFKLFARIASLLGALQQHGYIIPHLILDDLLVIKTPGGELDVKIDYKLSRFLDPRLDRPPPALKHLLDCHPDIIQKRPLRFRSDIWSLGKIFVEILSADFATNDYLSIVDTLGLPEEIAMLFKSMLADDPKLRPRYMHDVAETLAAVKKQDITKARKIHEEGKIHPGREIKKLQVLLKFLVAAVLVAIIAVFSWWIYDSRRYNQDIALEKFANRYSKSVAFVMVDYWIAVGKIKIYRNRSEGTAFLVDSEGYLITSRHVACPWLEDPGIRMILSQFRQSSQAPVFGYNLYLWFEGGKAFNRTAGFIESEDVEDQYFLKDAYKSNGQPGIKIAGVAQVPLVTRQVVISPLRNDFAILKIDEVPAGLISLPLDTVHSPETIPKLSRLVVLGFPLGSRTQQDQVNVGVTRAAIRRTFPNLIQIEGAIYAGNSGGPVIDERGLVIGIASGVATEGDFGGLRTTTKLWDLGMVLPISEAASLLAELKKGRIKWDGSLDLKSQSILTRIRDEAKKLNWKQAADLVDKALVKSREPQLYLAAGMMHFCIDDKFEARRIFEETLSINQYDNLSRLMIFILDWLNGEAKTSIHGKALLEMDWRSSDEFFGYLAKILSGHISVEKALEGWNSKSERAWINYIVGLIHAKKGSITDSARNIRAAMRFADPAGWEYLLTLAQLQKIRAFELEGIKNQIQRKKKEEKYRQIDNETSEANQIRINRLQSLIPLAIKMNYPKTSSSEKALIMEEFLKIDPEDSNTLGSIIYFWIMAGEWEKARLNSVNFLKRPGREDAGRLGIKVLYPCVLMNLNLEKEAMKAVEDVKSTVSDEWFLSIADCLSGKLNVDELLDKTGSDPYKLLTGQVILGLWSEAQKEYKAAGEHYKTALESFLDNWMEYDLARERLKVLRKNQNLPKPDNNTIPDVDETSVQNPATSLMRSISPL